MPQQLYGLTIEDIRWLRRLKADLDSGKARILRRREATSAPNIQTVKASSATLNTSDPNEDRFPGNWYERNPSTGALTQKDAIWIVTPNGEDVTTTDYYECAVQRGFENGRPVFCAIIPGAGGGTTITVQEQDGSPSYTSIDTVQVHQGAGFVLTNPSAGKALINQTAADWNAVGYVSTSTQQFTGIKEFVSTQIIVSTSHSSPTGQLKFTAAEGLGTIIHVDNTHSDQCAIKLWANSAASTQGLLLTTIDNSSTSNPYYGVIDSGNNTVWGVYGTDSIGNVVKGGIVTTVSTTIMSTTPTTSGSTGTAGQIAFDTTYLYVCTATNTWKRLTLATF